MPIESSGNGNVEGVLLAEYVDAELADLIDAEVSVTNGK